MYRRTAYPSPDKDLRLESVADKLTTLQRQIDDADWNGSSVTNEQRGELSYLRQMTNEGRLWIPKF